MFLFIFIFNTAAALAYCTYIFFPRGIMTNIYTSLYLFTLLNGFCYALIGPNDKVFTPKNADEVPDNYKHRFMIGSDGGKIINGSGDLTIRFSENDKSLFFRILPSANSDGCATFCFPTMDILRSQHFECKVGQCGMKFCFFDGKIYLNHDAYFLPLISNEPIIFGYVDKSNLKIENGVNQIKSFPARCSILNDFVVESKIQLTFDVYYKLANAKLELISSDLIIKGSPPIPSTLISFTLEIICAFSIPFLIVIGIAEVYYMCAKRNFLKEMMCSKTSTPKIEAKTKTKTTKIDKA